MTIIGSYAVRNEIGRGGMGVVYEAVHTTLSRLAAVKVLLAQFTRDPGIVQRFFNEARAASTIRHPGIVEIYDFGFTPAGDAYIVMELLEGESLGARLQRLGQLPALVAAGIARQIAAALGAAHRIGIVHRDLKPDNIFLVPDAEVSGGERVKLLDFGIAKLTVDDRHASQTSTGIVVGTPTYMSPEQCAGSRHLDARSDLYALGCLLYRMLAGRVPFEGDVGWVIGAHQHLAPPPLEQLAPGTPAAIATLVARLLAKTPDARPASATEVAEALRQVPMEPRLPDLVRAVARPPTPSEPTTLSAGVGVDDGRARQAAPRRGYRIALPVAAVLAVGAAVAVLATGGGSRSTTDTAAVAAVGVTDAMTPIVPTVAESPSPVPAAPPVDAAAPTPAVDGATAPTPPRSPVEAPPTHRDPPREPPRPSPHPAPPPVAAPVATTAPAPPLVDAAALVDAALADVRADRYSGTLDKCQRALAAAPSPGVRIEATELCARAACKLKSPSLAARYVRGLDGARRTHVVAWCRQFGLAFDP